MKEAFTNGVFTREINRLSKYPSLEGLSASQASEINKGFNEQMAVFRKRALEKERILGIVLHHMEMEFQVW